MVTDNENLILLWSKFSVATIKKPKENQQITNPCVDIAHQQGIRYLREEPALI